MNDFDFLSENARVTLDCVKCGVLLLDAELKIMYINAEYEEITGLSRDDLVGKTSQYMVQNGMASFSLGLEIQRTLKSSSHVQTFSNKKTVLVSGGPIMEGGSLKIIVITINDITVESQMYKELKEEKEKADTFRQNFEQTLTKGIIYSGPAMQKVISTALKAARSSSSVLLYGETGVGKEVIANLIYNASDRSHRPLIKVNCAAIPHGLAESEFFGYAEGAFTGARSGGAAGVFELADRGTILLDEIEELSLGIQCKLLRTLQDQEVTRLGGRSKSKKLDFRVIAATNQPLMKLINEGKFRADLYYRINVINITIPPLREHPEDIAALVASKMDRLVSRYHISKKYSKEAMSFLQRYYWPGNIRELENVVERLYFSTENGNIEEEDIIQAIEAHNHAEEDGHRESDSLKVRLQRSEIKILHEAVHKFRTMREAALYLGIDPATMTRKCKQYNIKV